MALGNITLYTPAAQQGVDGRTFTVASGTSASINAGEPVAKALGNSTGNVVSAGVTSAPVVGTSYLAGISATTSNETSTATGVVEVLCGDNEQTWICQAVTLTSVNTQAKYDALVGARVTFSLSAGVYTVNLTDSANNGLVIEPLDISKYPGFVRFSIRGGAFYNA